MTIETIHCTYFFGMGGFKHPVRGGNAELATAVPGLEVVVGHKDAATWIPSKGLVVNGS